MACTANPAFNLMDICLPGQYKWNPVAMFHPAITGITVFRRPELHVIISPNTIPMNKYRLHTAGNSPGILLNDGLFRPLPVQRCGLSTEQTWRWDFPRKQVGATG